MKSISSRIALFSILICSISGVLFSVNNFFEERDYLVRVETYKGESELKILENLIKLNIHKLEQSTQFIAQTPPISGIIRARANNGIDIKGKSTEKDWKRRLQTIFTEILHTNPEYRQVRFIGKSKNGKEIVRVDRVGKKVLVASEKNLQSKGEEFYFKEIMKMKLGSTYISKFTLNRENGKIVYPTELVKRAAVPIYKNAKEIFGFVIINADYTSIFDGPIELKARKNHVVVQASTGAVLLNTFVSESLEVLKRKRVFSSEKLEINEESYIEISKKVFYNISDLNDYIDIKYYINKASLELLVKENTRNKIILYSIFILFVGFLAYFLSKKTIDPINELIQDVEDYQKSDSNHFKYVRKINDSYEVRKLNKAFSEISRSTAETKRHIDLQKKALDSSAIVAETDADGKITYVNDKFIEISKYSYKELIGKDHRILNSGYHESSFFEQMWNTIKLGQVWNGEIRNRAKDNSIYWVDTTIFPVINEGNKIEKFVAIRFDITDKKNIQDIYKKNLESKSRFFANMSHELRTPLNGIIGFSQLLKDKMTGVDKENSDYLESILNCSESLLSIINDILDISKLDANKLSIEKMPISLEEVVHTSINILNTQIKDKNIRTQITISKDTPDYVLGDPLRLKQILLNLVSNAVKFTHEEGVIEVDLSVEEVIGDNYRLRFSVKDNGIGISKENQGKIFSDFEQTDNSITREFGGTGLGLAIASNLVNLMDGRVWFESEYNIGTVFYFSITVKKTTTIPSNTRVDLDQKEVDLNDELKCANKECKVLIAEDNSINQKVLTKYLEKLNFQHIDIADDGQISIEMAKKTEYDFIFMDVQMPIMDGYTATKIIKEKLNHNAKIIGVSANVFKEDEEKGLEVGMDAYIGKPVNKKKIEETLKGLVSNNSQ